MRGEWGRIIEPEAIEAALQGGRTKLVATIHGETSTGVLQPLEDIARLAHAHGALLMTDAVVTLGGCEVAVDRWGVDIAVAGTQKCLSCPSGLAPVTFNARVEAAIRSRRRKVQSNYLDLGQLIDYWSPARFNHHTAPTAMVYGLREALRADPGGGPRRAVRPPSPPRRRPARRPRRARADALREGSAGASPAVHHPRGRPRRRR